MLKKLDENFLAHLSFSQIRKNSLPSAFVRQHDMPVFKSKCLNDPCFIFHINSYTTDKYLISSVLTDRHYWQ